MKKKPESRFQLRRDPVPLMAVWAFLLCAAGGTTLGDRTIAQTTAQFVGGILTGAGLTLLAGCLIVTWLEAGGPREDHP